MFPHPRGTLVRLQVGQRRKVNHARKALPERSGHGRNFQLRHRGGSEFVAEKPEHFHDLPRQPLCPLIGVGLRWRCGIQHQPLLWIAGAAARKWWCLRHCRHRPAANESFQFLVGVHIHRKPRARFRRFAVVPQIETYHANLLIDAPPRDANRLVRFFFHRCSNRHHLQRLRVTERQIIRGELNAALRIPGAARAHIVNAVACRADHVGLMLKDNFRRSARGKRFVGNHQEHVAFAAANQIRPQTFALEEFHFAPVEFGGNDAHLARAFKLQQS